MSHDCVQHDTRRHRASTKPREISWNLGSFHCRRSWVSRYTATAVALINIRSTGPIVGGALAVIDWKWIFRLNMLLTIIPLLGIVFYMPLKKVEAGWKLKLVSVDFIGVGVALASMSQIVFGLTAIGRSFYGPSVAIVAVLISGILLFMSFFLWQWKGASLPLVPIRIFRGKIVNGCSIINIIIGWNFFVSLYYIPSFYQVGLSGPWSFSMLVLTPGNQASTRLLSNAFWLPNSAHNSHSNFQQHLIRLSYHSYWEI